MPWILCGPARPPESTGEEAGSTAITRSCGLRSLRKPPAPVIVPPVPAPATRQSTLPSSASHSSGPVPRRCASGLAGFVNWSGSQKSSSRASAWAAATASFIPPIDSVTWTCAP